MPIPPRSSPSQNGIQRPYDLDQALFILLTTSKSPLGVGIDALPVETGNSRHFIPFTKKDIVWELKFISTFVFILFFSFESGSKALSISIKSLYPSPSVSIENGSVPKTYSK